MKRQQVLTLLRNRLFVGRVQWGPAFRDDCHEPIVTKAQFERVQRLLDANRKGRTNTRKSRDYGYPLRGLGTETATAKHRLSEVAGQIGRLVALLCDPDFDALVSVKRQLQELEAEQAELRVRVNQLEAQCEPLTTVIAAARAFIDNWSGLDAILAQATPDELRTILPHFIEVVEIRTTDDTGHMGEYRLAMLPGLGSGSRDGKSESGGPLGRVD